MDTSETYIKMCDCEEIQGAKPTGEHSWIGNIYKGKLWMQPKTEPFLFATSDPSTTTEETIWLPRQDQLQEMVKPEYVLSQPIWLVYKLKDWCCDHARDNFPPHRFTSMEQLWLAFVMEEKYDKVWTGEQWEIV